METCCNTWIHTYLKYLDRTDTRAHTHTYTINVSNCGNLESKLFLPIHTHTQTPMHSNIKSNRHHSFYTQNESKNNLLYLYTYISKHIHTKKHM